MARARPAAPAPPAPRSSPVTGAELAGDGLKYVGSRYVFGGAPGTVKGRDDGADCSSFINMIAGRDYGLAIPGVKAGGYSGASHGPPVIAWAGWRGAVTIPGPPVAGDLCVWPGLGAGGHIGMAVSSTEMVSALNPSLGVVKTKIAGNGPAGVRLEYRRITGVVLGGGSAADAVAAGQAPGGAGGVLVLAAAALPVLFAAGILLAALLGGVLAAGLIVAVVAGGRE